MQFNVYFFVDSLCDITIAMLNLNELIQTKILCEFVIIPIFLYK